MVYLQPPVALRFAVTRRLERSNPLTRTPMARRRLPESEGLGIGRSDPQ